MIIRIWDVFPSWRTVLTIALAALLGGVMAIGVSERLRKDRQGESERSELVRDARLILESVRRIEAVVVGRD